MNIRVRAAATRFVSILVIYTTVIYIASVNSALLTEKQVKYVRDLIETFILKQGRWRLRANNMHVRALSNFVDLHKLIRQCF